MRRLLLSVFAVGALAPAAAMALASDNPQKASSPNPPATNARQLRAYQAKASATLRRAEARARTRKHTHRVSVSPALQAIAACESRDDPHAIGGGGAFRGKYQFDYGTWASVGGHGDPAAAPEAEQDRRAAMLYAREGATPWPVCGRG